MKNTKTFLGLDIGTDSVGWAVTDESYVLKKYKGNLMWGVHLFDAANQSAERRGFRTARRRLDRRQQRINLLQSFFEADILKTDPNFFFRLKESTLLPEDSEHRKHNIFFDDPSYGDKEYFAQFPTIHHLICELIKDDSPHDIRLVYYACAYILAHRGHFLFHVSKDNIDNITEFNGIYSDFYTALTEVDENPPFDPDPDGMAEVLRKSVSVSAKDKALKQMLFGGGKPPKSVEKSSVEYAQLTKLICGGTSKLSDLFSNESYKDLEKNSVCVKNADFSDTLDLLCGQIEDLHFKLLANVKAIYDWSLLVDILNGETMISRSKVRIYDTHREDLENLKYLVRTYLSKTEYTEIFKNIGNKPNYVSYVYNASSNVPRDGYKKCSQEDFCKFLKPYLGKINPSDDDKERYDEVLQKCNDNTLCPKQVTTDNRVIPYQLYYVELKKILENASTYLEFLNEKDQDGSVLDKILSIMEFRIPYYAGPLVNSEKSKNAWLIRKAEGKIYPWNFELLVDEDLTENEFIRRMTCKCTYLAGQDVLPKYSLLYCKFSVLNEINNIKVNGDPISVAMKQRLYEDKFVASNIKLTKKRIADYIRSVGKYSGEVEITGIDDHIKSSLKSYHDFKNLLENGSLTEADVEAIIERITVTTDTRRLKKWLKQEFPHLSKADIAYISKLKYKDYGRLSRNFLENLLPLDIKTGEVIGDQNILSMLWDTNENLMQLLSMNYGYASAVDAFNMLYYDQPENKKTISERLKDMYIPTAVRRSVTRTLDIVKELKPILKKDPDKIFIEMARGTGDTPKGKRTKSRKEQILAFFDTLDEHEITELKLQLECVDDGKLRSEKYFLYFMQLGRCMYTQKPISFDELEDNHRWNIDHIWPQAKIKDDSIDNKVLVDTNANGQKGDSYPISRAIREKMHSFWTMLKLKGLISEKKYARLSRSTPFTDEELSGFIARQLVETRQSTKAVATLLNELFPDTEIVYVKAGLVSEFRQEMDMLKCREINDLHHAKDAYLNIVMGNVYHTRFTKDPLHFVRTERNYSIKLTTLLSKRTERNGEVAWNPDVSFGIVRRMMEKNSVRYVRYAYKRKGGFFNQMPERKKEGLVPRKNGLDTGKYGGYNNTTASYFSLVKHGKSIVIIPIETMYTSMYEKDCDFALKYAAKQLSSILSENISSDRILMPLKNRILKINTLIEIDGFRCNIVQKSNKGRTLVLSSAESLIVPSDSYDYIKKICSFIEKSERGRKFGANNYAGINSQANIALFDLFVNKMLSKPFDKVLMKIGEKIKNKREVFIALDITEQTFGLYNIMMLMKTGRSTGCDLKAVNESGQAGVITLNSDISKIKGKKTIRIIDQSPTGLIEKKSVNLLTL